MAELFAGAINVTDIGQRAARFVRQELSLDRSLDRIEAVLGTLAKPWHSDRLNDRKLPLLMYAKHVLAEHLMVLA